MDKTIVDLVEEDTDLQAELRKLVDEAYLLPGVFHPKAYLIDELRINAEWKKRRNKSLSRIALLAIGVTIYDQGFREVYARIGLGEDPRFEPQIFKWLTTWRNHVASQLPDDPTLDKIAASLGQYLEYMNRKSQGF